MYEYMPEHQGCCSGTVWGVYLTNLYGILCKQKIRISGLYKGKDRLFASFAPLALDENRTYGTEDMIHAAKEVIAELSACCSKPPLTSAIV